MLGFDTEHKQELVPDLLPRADLLISDSIAQSQERGEIFLARQASVIADADVIELGALLQDLPSRGSSDQQVTIAD